jgi:hypothetical protein
MAGLSVYPYYRLMNGLLLKILSVSLCFGSLLIHSFHQFVKLVDRLFKNLFSFDDTGVMSETTDVLIGTGYYKTQ